MPGIHVYVCNGVCMCYGVCSKLKRIDPGRDKVGRCDENGRPLVRVSQSDWVRIEQTNSIKSG